MWGVFHISFIGFSKLNIVLTWQVLPSVFTFFLNLLQINLKIMWQIGLILDFVSSIHNKQTDEKRTFFVRVSFLVTWWQCVNQTMRVSCLSLNLGGGWGMLGAVAAGGLPAQPNFFFSSYVVSISFRIEFDVWVRLCRNINYIFFGLGRLRCHQEVGDYYRDFKGGREQRYTKT